MLPMRQVDRATSGGRTCEDETLRVPHVVKDDAAWFHLPCVCGNEKGHTVTRELWIYRLKTAWIDLQGALEDENYEETLSAVSNLEDCVKALLPEAEL